MTASMVDPDAAQADAPARDDSPQGRGGLIWLGVALVAFATVLLRTAWVGDDAFITLRTVDNFTQGYGLRWNVADRVQTYTHPLWMALLCIPYWLYRHPLFACYLLSFLCTAGCLLVLVRGVARNAAAAAIAVGCLVASKGFMEFSTSGLENPLSHMLLALAVWQAMAMDRDTDGAPRRFVWCALAAGLAVLNRVDLGLLVTPWLLWGWSRVGFWPGLRCLLLGFTPLACWLLFAFVYYGSPLPITAYAKLNHGIPSGELWWNGLRHLVFATGFDPASVLIVSLGAILGLRRPGVGRWVTLGALLYVVYLVKIGGDFMGTRFFAAPVLLVTLVVARTGWLAAPPWRGGLAVGALLLLGLLVPVRTHLTSGSDWGKSRTTGEADDDSLQARKAGSDERHGYFWVYGLLSNGQASPIPAVVTDATLPALGFADRTAFSVESWIGARAYMAGPQVHFVDYWLCDPLLMRLPMHDPELWRVGHFTRRVPEGYLRTLTHGENRIDHPGLAAHVEDLLRITRLPVFAGERWQALWRLWSGHHDAGLKDYIANEYRATRTREVAAADLAEVLNPQLPWFLWDRPLMPDGGTRVSFPEPVAATGIQLGLATRCIYRVRFIRAGEAVHEQVVEPELGPAGEFGVFMPTDLKVPTEARGFDAVLVMPKGYKPGHHRLGWVLPKR